MEAETEAMAEVGVGVAETAVVVQKAPTVPETDNRSLFTATRDHQQQRG